MKKLREFKLCNKCNSDIVNRLKSDASLEDLKKIINFYIKK